jgi:hypothetical protein
MAGELVVHGELHRRAQLDNDRHGPDLLLAGDAAPPAREAGSLALEDERINDSY